MLLRVTPGLHEDLPRVGAGLVVHGQEQVTVDGCVIRPRPALGGNRRWPRPRALILAGVGEISERPEMVGVDPHGVLEGSQGLIGLTLGVARQAQVVPGVHQVRPELNRPLEAQPRLCLPGLVQEHQAEIVVRSARSGSRYSACSKLSRASSSRPRAIKASPMFEYAPTQSGQSRRACS